MAFSPHRPTHFYEGMAGGGGTDISPNRKKEALPDREKWNFGIYCDFDFVMRFRHKNPDFIGICTLTKPRQNIDTPQQLPYLQYLCIGFANIY